MKNLGLRITGLLLFLLAILGLLATITLSISGGANDYTNINTLSKTNDLNGLFKLSGFIIATVFIQLMIFTVSSIQTYVKNKFNIHFKMILFLQYGLLIVSIYYNNKFFGANSIIKLLLCILLDLSVIKLVSLSIDLITLNFTLCKTKTDNILKMFINNLFFKKVANIKNIYEVNHNLNLAENKIESSNELKEVLPIKNEAKKTSNTSKIESSKLIDFSRKINLAKNKTSNEFEENYKKFFEYIISNNKAGFIKGYKSIAKEIEISEAKAKTIFNELIKNGIIQVENKKSKLIMEEKQNEKM